MAPDPRSVIAPSVSDLLRDRLQSSLGAAHTLDRAHDLFLEGRSIMRDGHPAALRKSIALWDEAIARDTAFALPHAALAWTYALLPIMSDVPAAGVSVRRALELDPGSAEAHRFYAIWLKGQRHFTDAEVHARRAVEIDPLMAEGHLVLGWVHMASGRAAEGSPHILQSVEMAPAFAFAYEMLVLTYVLLGRLGDARFRTLVARLRHAPPPPA